MVPDTVTESDTAAPVEALDKVFDLLIEKCEFLVRRLRDFVAFPTVSSDPTKKPDIREMAEYLVNISKRFGLDATLLPITLEEVDANDPPPPLVLAETKFDPTKRTVCFYGHFDVRPLTIHDYWYSDPFVLTSNNEGTLVYGKGSSMGKGPLLCLINAIGAYQQLKIDLPINVKIIMDPLGLADEELTAKFLRKTSLEFFANIDFVCMCVGQWFGDVKPTISHGSRGLCYFTMQIDGPNKDLHSGHYGGLLNEPMADLVYMMDQLVDKRGNIKITDIYEDVTPVTKEERDYYQTIQFVVCNFKRDLGAQELLANEDKKSLLMNLWRMPSLTIHGIEGAFSGPHTRNIIPCKVTGKFSINIVPNMTPSKVKKSVFAYLGKQWKARKSTNKIKVQMTIGKLAWFTDPKDVNCIAAVNAVKRVYNEEPELIRDSKRVRMANTLRRITNASVITIPVGKAKDVADASAEKIDLTNYINGCKIFATYFQEISTLSPKVMQHEKPPCFCKTTGELTDCNCYLNAGWMVEEEEDEEEEESSSLGDSVYVSSLHASCSTAGRADQPTSTRYHSYISRVKKKIEALQKVIVDGETIIGLKYTKEAVDTETGGEEESDSHLRRRDVNGTVEYEKSYEATAKEYEAPTKTMQPEGSLKSLQSARSGIVAQSIKAEVSKIEVSSYFGKPTSQVLATLARSSANASVGLEITKQSLRGSESGQMKLGVSPQQLISSDVISGLSDERRTTADVDDFTGMIKRGYVGKRPFSLNGMTTNQLAHEPFGIISSLSALLYKRRRAQKPQSASMKPLAGSRVIPGYTRSSNLKFASSAALRHLSKEQSTAEKTLGYEEQSKLSNIFVTIDQPSASTNDLAKAQSHKAAKRESQKRTPSL